MLNEYETTDSLAGWSAQLQDAGATKLATLVSSLEATLADRRDEARRALGALVDHLDVDAVPEDLIHLLFAAAVARRLGGDQAEAINLYLRRYEQPQIDLFNLLAERMPLASMAGSIANELLAGFLENEEEAALLDVGIGTGRQEVLLLQMLAERGRLPRRLTIIGVEPSLPSLRRAEETLGTLARRLGVALRFHPIARVAEELHARDWALFRRMSEPLLVNAAFALHHMGASEDGPEARDVLFQRLADLSPRAVVLCEPNSNHHRVPMAERFRNAWRHFSHIFQLLDELDISSQERTAIKMFFGREVDDIIGTVDDAQRCERHEHAGAWLARLHRHGFTLADGLERIRPPGHPAVAVVPSRGSIGLEYRGETIVAVLCGVRPER
ncbi:GAI protein [Myxococcaceae bacterium GXIMD 01537]